jgi:hypothetical protein
MYALSNSTTGYAMFLAVELLDTDKKHYDDAQMPLR